MDRIRRPAVGDPERAARLREIALKAAAKRRANLALGIVPKAKKASAAVAAVNAVKRFLRIPVMDGLETVTECGHNVADLMEVVRIARANAALPAPIAAPRFYCDGCIALGRSGTPLTHHVGGTVACGRCACAAFVQGREYVERVFGNAPRWQAPKVIVAGSITAKYLGHGASRVTYDLGCGQCAVKTLHLNDVGWGANAMPFQSQAECDFYEQADDDMRPFLTAIKARTADYAVEVVEKVDVKRPDDGEATMRRLAAKHGIRDLHPANVGWRNGRMVILDFGFAPK